MACLGLGSAAALLQGGARFATSCRAPPPPAAPRRLRHAAAQLSRRQPSTQLRAIPVSGPSEPSAAAAAAAGQVSKALMESMTRKISEALQTDRVRVVDVNGDGRHCTIDVVSPLFEGQSAVKRQRLVYKAIWEELQEAVHAVDAMTTKTPQEAQ